MWDNKQLRKYEKEEVEKRIKKKQEQQERRTSARDKRKYG
jgi:hypothetical protein